MKPFFSISLILSLSIVLMAAGTVQAPGAKAQTNIFRSIAHKAFKKGEVLEYKMHYGPVDAGVARIEIMDEEHKIGDRNVLHIVGTGKSNGAFDLFFKVRDQFETYVDEEGVFPWFFSRRCDEGGYKIKQDYVFHQSKNVMEDKRKAEEMDVPANIQDMISAYYYARTLDMNKTKIGDTITVPTVVDNEIFPLQIKYKGLETVKTGLGKFECMKFNPIVQAGRIFKSEEDLEVFITNDENKIPVLAKAHVLVGSIQMELTSYENLANPIAKIN